MLTESGNPASLLPKAIRGILYEASQSEAAAAVDQAQARVEAKPGAKVKRKGGVYYGYEGKTMAQAKKKLSDKQAVAVDFANRLAASRGLTVYFYESYLDENGERVYKDRNGNVVKSENGFYDPTDGSIHVDLNAGSYGRGTVLFTISHELVHFIQDWSPKHYKMLCDILVKGYEAKGQSIEGLVKQQQADAAERDRKLTWDQAYDEVMADSMESILADGRVMELMQSLEAADKSLGGQVKRFFRSICNLLKRTIHAYSNVKPDSTEGRLVQQMQDLHDQLQQVFAEGLYEGGDNFRKAEKNTTAEGGVKYEIREVGNTGRFYVQADRQVLTGGDASLWGKQIENYINEQIRKDQDIAIPTSDGHVLLLTGRSAYKLSDKHVASIVKKIEAVMSDADYALKGRAATHIDELIQVARFNGYEADLDNKHENDIGEDGFNYFESYFRDFDGKYYRVPLSSALNKQEETAYSIGRIRQRSFPAGRGSSSQKEALKNGRKASTDIIYTSAAKSQEVKTAVQLAYEKALKKKDDGSKRSTRKGESGRILAVAQQENLMDGLNSSERSVLESFNRAQEELKAQAAEKAKQENSL